MLCSTIDPAHVAIAKIDAFLRRIAKRYVTWSCTEEDLHQEARLAFLKAYPNYDPTRAGLTTFAFQQAKAACHRYHADKRNMIRKPQWQSDAGNGADQCTHSTDDDFEDREEGVDPRKQIEDRIFIEQMLAPLRPHQQQIIRLHMQGYTDREIGEKLGLREQNIHNHRHRALDAMRRAYDRS